MDLLYLFNTAFDRKRIFANPNPNPNFNLKGVLYPNFRPFSFQLRKKLDFLKHILI